MNAIELEDVWKFYGDFPALRKLDLAVPEGACLALLGRNGAGKTTLLRVLAGLMRAGRGSVRVLGADPRNPEVRARLGVLGHGVALYDDLSAFENLALFARLYGLEDASRRARQWLEKVGLGASAGSLVREFSRGMRQRLAIARAFLHDPELLLLDEPFTALDDRAADTLQELLREALARRRTIVLSTHHLKEALERATHAALLVHGRLAFFGERSRRMLEDPGWLYREFGEAA
ncbi:MAG: ABC transporter ATP-binding protein [Bryobacterales bacterium]|nr:ABC transporter ATP-binding protein [Bryobacteraceae bacterium]MDW8129097.1 ABC transporter ATP-binding protein [Bryobacterales bacterium]